MYSKQHKERHHIIIQQKCIPIHSTPHSKHNTNKAKAKAKAKRTDIIGKQHHLEAKSNKGLSRPPVIRSPHTYTAWTPH
jgi:hypothetical protein